MCSYRLNGPTYTSIHTRGLCPKVFKPRRGAHVRVAGNVQREIEASAIHRAAVSDTLGFVLRRGAGAMSYLDLRRGIQECPAHAIAIPVLHERKALAHGSNRSLDTCIVVIVSPKNSRFAQI